jgi:hypothetical protein
MTPSISSPCGSGVSMPAYANPGARARGTARGSPLHLGMMTTTAHTMARARHRHRFSFGGDGMGPLLGRHRDPAPGRALKCAHVEPGH